MPFPSGTLLPGSDVFPGPGIGAGLGGRPLTARGRQYLDWLPTIFRDTPEYVAVLHALSREVDLLEAAIEMVRQQFFPQTADVLLGAWEEMLGLPVAPAGRTLPQRRNSLLAALAAAVAAPSGAQWGEKLTHLIGPTWTVKEYLPTDMRRLNLFTNPRAGTNTTHYTQNAASGSLSRVTATPPPEVAGTHAIQQVNPGTHASEGVRIDSLTADPEGTYTVSEWVKTTSGTMALALDVTERDSGDVLLGTTSTNFTATTSWQRVGVTRAFVDDGVKVSAAVRAVGTVAGTFQTVGLLVEESAVLGSYFDGAESGYEWLGTADASQSRETSPDPYTLIVTVPYAPGTTLHQQVVDLLATTTPAHLHVDVAFEGGFLLDLSHLDEDTLR